MTLELIVRPFTTPEVTPTPYTPQGQRETAPVLLAIGRKGGTKTFSYSGSSSISTYMQATHNEHSASDGSEGSGGSTPGSYTRETHINRIKNPNDSSQYIDVEIMDAIHFIGPNGRQQTLRMAGNPNAKVTDNTGNA